jgi:hypothetical protein
MYKVKLLIISAILFASLALWATVYYTNNNQQSGSTIVREDQQDLAFQQKPPNKIKENSNLFELINEQNKVKANKKNNSADDFTSPEPNNLESETSSINNANNKTTKNSADDARELFLPLVQKKIEKPKESLNNNWAGPPTIGDSFSKAEITPSPSPSPSPSDDLPWAFGQARGYAMLYAMQPQARFVVEQQVKNLLESRIREVYISVLIDGTFGQDFPYLQSIIQRLSADRERNLTLALYLSNGPTMRKWDQTPIRTAFSQYEPREFRRRIMWDERIKAQFKENIDHAINIFSYNLSVNPKNKNIVFAMLEDNLDRDSYFLMRSQVESNIGKLARFMRNPCEGCYGGNNSDGLGAHIEEHHPSLFAKLGQLDSFTLDGIGFDYPNSNTGNPMPADQVIQIMNIGLQKGLSFIGLWQPKWQGLGSSDTSVHPDQRPYLPSSKSELEFEVKLLREGLSLEIEQQ